MSTKVAENLRYTKSHEWVKMENGVATIGISDFAQHQLGDIVHVDAPEVGTTVDAGEVLGAIESVKTVSDFYAPISGEILEINGEIENEPQRLNEAPYEGGWILKMKPSEPAQVESLLQSAEYQGIVG